MQTKIYLLALIVVSGITVFGFAQEKVSFPYQAFVLNEQAPLRSGPGGMHYETDKLEKGSSLSVYRHDPGGWCAVQPPEGSFSLIPETAIEIIEEGIGKVKTEGTQVWVGTRLGAVDKPLWQIKLKQDELVEILGQISWPDPDGHSTIWYQIAPPAGEFRWIQMSDLQLPPDMNDRPSIIDPNVVPASGAGSGQADVSQAVYESAPPADTQLHRIDHSVNAGWRPASRAIPNNQRNTTPSNESPGRSGNQSIPNSSGFSTPAIPNSFDSSRPISGNFSNQSMDRYADARMMSSDWSYGSSTVSTEKMSLQQIDLQLSEEMLGSPDQWQIDDLESQIQSAQQDITSASDREYLNRLSQKIQNCRRIRDKFRAAYNMPANTSGRAIGSGIADVELGTKYDAHGVLKKLARDRGRLQYTYVIEDPSGKITHHISGIPGLNLHRYLNQTVGVIGQRGYHKTLNLDHVTAERVIVLNQNR